MAENADGQEKTEPPSAKRLGDAREKGQVAKSQDASAAALMLFGAIAVYTFGGNIGNSVERLMRQLFFEAHLIFLTEANTVYYFGLIIKMLAFVLLPLLGTIVVVAVLADVSQVGFRFATKKFTSGMNILKKFNLFAGIKRIMFSSRSLVELLKGIVKIFVVGIVVYSVLSGKIDKFVELIRMPHTQFIPFMASVAFELIYKVGIAYIIMGIGDFFYQKYKFTEEMKMTKQEVKDESKAAEGDMQSKMRMRQIGRDRLRRIMLSRVREATVVITNPTHFAVALQYEPGMEAPKVVAKGTDNLAFQIRELATKSNVPIVEDKPLARALYAQVEVDQTIPEALFKAVAQVLAYLHRLKKQTW